MSDAATVSSARALRRLPPTPPLHKHQRRPRSLLSRARSTIRTWFRQPALVLNDSAVEVDGNASGTSQEDIESVEMMELSKNEMLEVAKEVRMRISKLYAACLNIDAQTGSATVDYIKVVHSPDFSRYLQATKKLRFVDPTRLYETERTAFFLNLYNALMIHGIVQLPRPTNLFQRLSIFDTAAYDIGGRIYTLNDIEHGVLRANKGHCGPFSTQQFEESDARRQCVLPRVDPRIHFALSCGARSCPSIRCYSPDNLNEALDDATKIFLMDMDIDVKKREVIVSQIMKWYQDDFAPGGNVYDVLKWTMRYLDNEKREKLQEMIVDHESGRVSLKVTYASYDWSLNDSFY